MKTTKMNTTDLTSQDLLEIKGGFIFILLFAAEGLISAGILTLPVASAFYKGWNDYSKN
jgi:hypothetical protein